MVIRLLAVLLVIMNLPSILSGQETGYGPGYQTMFMSNPALTGSETDGTLRLSYLNYYPGKSYNLHSVYASYDSYFTEIHGGAGFYISDDYLGGIVNDMRGGLSYAYFLQAGKDFYINAGLSASFYHRGYSFGNAILPDQIDPLGVVSFPSGESLPASGRTVFDLGAGFLFLAGNIIGGVSVNHLAEPYISETGRGYDKLKRKLLVHLAGDFGLSKQSEIKIRPLAVMEIQNKFITGGPGVVFESRFLSFNTLLLVNNENEIDIQTGFSLETGKVITFYTYRFNIVSGNNLMPFSLLLQTGLSFSLNNFDKRKSTKTINLPKM